MRKLLVLLMASTIAVSMVSCTSDAEKTDDNTSTTTSNSEQQNEDEDVAKDEYTFGYIAYDMTDIWNEYSANAFEYAATKQDAKVNTVVLDSKNSLEESITAMESLIQQEVDGISVFPISTEQGSQLVKMANDAGIPVTVENFDLSPLDDPGDYIASVACEYDEIGYAAIEYIAEKKPGAKVFFCAGQQGAGVYEKYQEGVDRALKDFEGQVSVVATVHGDWLTDKAYNVTTDLISSGEEFDYIFANNGMMAKGCYQALEDAGMTDIPIVSTGGSPDDETMLIDGIEESNMTAPVSLQGVQTFKNLYDFVVDDITPTEKFSSLPVVPVSASEMDEFIAWDDYEAAYNYVYKK